MRVVQVAQHVSLKQAVPGTHASPRIRQSLAQKTFLSTLRLNFASVCACISFERIMHCHDACHMSRTSYALVGAKDGAALSEAVFAECRSAPAFFTNRRFLATQVVSQEGAGPAVAVAQVTLPDTCFRLASRKALLRLRSSPVDLQLMVGHTQMCFACFSTKAIHEQKLY